MKLFRFLSERLFFRLCLLIGVTKCGCVAAEDANVTKIDRSPVLNIGTYQVSGYLVDKFYNRFADKVRHERHCDPSAREAREWFRSFIAKQVIVAHAERLGYNSRPEVVDVVQRMERNMLSSPSGPFYKHLQNSECVPAISSSANCTRMSCARDGFVAEFPDGISAVEWLRLGTDFDTCSIEEQRRRISSCQGCDGVRVLDGSLSWPYYPFAEISDTVAEAPVGRWTIHREPWFGVYYIYIRSEKNEPAGLITIGNENTEVYAKMVRDTTVQQRHRNEVLFSAAFFVEEGTALHLAEVLADIDNRGEIPFEVVSQFEHTVLCHFKVGNETLLVSVEDFRKYFNGLFVRQLPRDLTSVRRAAEDLAVEELDVRKARELGIDRTPEFEENRKGFTGFQVLDLFEKERIVPSLNIGMQPIEAYYAAHTSDFSKASSVRGRVLEFPTFDGATQWMRDRQSHPNSGRSGTLAAAKDTQIVLTRGEALPRMESLRDIPQDCPDGTIIGPLQSGSAYLLFVKENTLTRSWVPLETAASTIRPILERQEVEAREIDFAADLLRTEAIDDRIDYSRYGLSVADASHRSSL